MSEDNKENKQAAKKKTLSLGSNVGISNIANSSDNTKVRGRFVTIEVKKGKGRGDIKGGHVKEKHPSSANNDGLSEQEKERREQILNNLPKAGVAKDKDHVVASSMQVVPKSEDQIVATERVKQEVQVEKKPLQPVREQKVEKKPIISRGFSPVIYNNSSSIVVPSAREETTVSKDRFDKPAPKVYSRDDAPSGADDTKKPKKKTTNVVEEKRKSNVKASWKSVVVSNDDESEDNTVVQFKQDIPKFFRAQKRKNKNIKVKAQDKLLREVSLSGSISVENLAHELSEKTGILLKTLLSIGVTANPNTMLDLETAELVTGELGHSFIKLDATLLENGYIHEPLDDKFTVSRPPVVTIMGHVDHGKTTLLDTIRKSKVVDKESGGITQHIGAYQVKTATGKMVTFLDTPGHEAFSQIRARGSLITDIVILVVAADDAVKPQTVEAIKHAQNAQVPIIVAINKIDKPDINIQKVKTELLQYNLVVEEMGGEVLCVEVSGKSNLGIDKLLDSVLLQAELMELKANTKAKALGCVIEVKQEKGLGALATVLVQRGVLKLGDIFVSGTTFGRVKVMIDDLGKRIKEAGVSCPVEISGFSGLTEAGADFFVVPSEQIANEIVQQRLGKITEEKNKSHIFDLSALLNKNTSNVKTLNLIIKADTQGSLEAVVSSLGKIQHEELDTKVIHHGVGEITESDITLSKTSGAIIVGFNARANNNAKDLAKKENIEIRYHSIIYNLVDDIKMILSGMLDPDIVENIIGYADVREVFNITKVGNIAGCYVTEGLLRRNAYVRLLRNNVVIHDGVLSVLKRFKDDVKEVKYNFECGASFDGYNDIVVGDKIECYEKVEIKNKLD